jgi:hypothetical protein
VVAPEPPLGVVTPEQEQRADKGRHECWRPRPVQRPRGPAQGEPTCMSTLTADVLDASHAIATRARIARPARKGGVRHRLSTYRPGDLNRLPPDFVPLFLTGRAGR